MNSYIYAMLVLYAIQLRCFSVIFGHWREYKTVRACTTVFCVLGLALFAFEQFNLQCILGVNHKLHLFHFFAHE